MTNIHNDLWDLYVNTWIEKTTLTTRRVFPFYRQPKSVDSEETAEPVLGGKGSDSVIWQKSLNPQKNPKSNKTTQERHHKRRLHNDCGPT